MADGMDEAGTPTCGSPAAGQQVMTVAGLTHQSINPFPTKFPATFDRAFLCIGWRLAASPRNWRGGMKTAPDGMSSRAAMHVARTLTGESIPAASGRQGCGDKPGRDRGGARRFGKGFARFVPAQRAARVRPAHGRAFAYSMNIGFRSVLCHLPLAICHRSRSHCTPKSRWSRSSNLEAADVSRCLLLWPAQASTARATSPRKELASPVRRW